MPTDPDVRTVITVPGDKSITHRALMFAALADGANRLRGLLRSEDTRTTAAVLRALGAAVPAPPPDAGEIIIQGLGLRGLRATAGAVDCGNSGTTARLLLGILAGRSFTSEITGDPSLRNRPMRRVTEPLERMGAQIEELGEPDRLPLRITGGRLRGITYESPSASAQVKSAVLLAGLIGGVPVRAREPYLSRDHTERMLRAMGAHVFARTVDGRPEAVLEPVSTLQPLDLTVPGDFSSAAFFAVLGLLSGPLRIRGVGLNRTRTGFLAVAERMGGRITVDAAPETGAEPAGDLLVEPAELRATTVEPAEIPALIDEIPALAVLAARAQGETRITGAGELRLKESDRLVALAQGLRAVGVEAQDDGGTLTVVGTDRPLQGRVSTYSDHRIAMAFGVLGAAPDTDITVRDPEAVAVSYPAFWDDLRRTAQALA